MTAGVRATLRNAGTAAALAWRAHPVAVTCCAATAVTSGLLPVLAAWLTKLVLDRLVAGARPGDLLPVALALAVAGLLAALLPALSAYVGAQLRRSLQLLIEDRLFTAVNALPGLRQFEHPEFHDRLRMGRDAGQEAPQQIVGAALAIGQAAITVGGFLATLLLLSPVMAAAVVLAAVPAIRIQISLSRERAETAWQVSPATRRRLFYSGLLTGVEAAKEIRLFGLGTLLRTRMLAELRSVNAAERAVDRRILRGTATMTVIGATVAGAGLVWAVSAAAAGRLTIGDVSVFLAALAGTQNALATIAGRLADMVGFLALFEHYLVIVRLRADLPVVRTAPEPRPGIEARRGIELRDVWFRYDDDHPWVLRGIDLFIPYGRATALVGLNGAGKSTLVKLLCRFYDPDRGAIRWDGVDLRDLDPAELRTRISAVFQDFMRYDLTAAENIGFGDITRARADRIEAAARTVGAHEMLAGLPNGYDTMLSRVFAERAVDNDPRTGVTLSGGQWQKVALARAFLRLGRELLILDEPSAGLDPEAEYALRTRLRAHREGVTSLLISHRLNAVRDADAIAVLADGRVVEYGNHDELMARTGAYARLFATQALGYAADPVPAGPILRITTPTTRLTST